MRVPILPPPGLVSDHTEYAAPGVWASGSNVRFFHAAPQAIGGETALSVDTYSAVSKMLAYKVSGVVHVATAGNQLYRVNSTTWARTDITPASGWSGSGFSMFSLAMFGDILLAVPHHNATPSSSGTLFTSTGGAQAVAVANAPDNIGAAMLVTPSRQVIVFGCNEETSGTYNGRCIRWSDIEDHTDWTTSSSNNAGEYILPGQDDIVAARLVGDHIAVWTKGSLWLGQYIGQPGQTFIFTRIGDPGIISRDCHAEFEGTVYWMAPDLFIYHWRPGMAPTKIECPCILDAWDTDIGVDSGYPRAADQQYFHAATIRKYGEVWFFFPSFGSQGATKYLAYCVNESRAAQRQVWFRGSMTASAVIDDPLLVDGLDLSDSTAIRIGYLTGVLTAIDQIGGSPTEPAWSIQSSFYYIDEGQRRVQVQRYIADTHGDSDEFKLSVLVRDYPEGLPITKGPFTIETSGTDLKQDFRASGRLVSVKFASSTTPGPWRLGRPVFEVVPLGNR